LIKKGYFPLLDLEVNGALNVKKIYSGRCISIFIQPPSIDVLRQRLLKRGSETEEVLNKRLKRAEKELAYADHFDYTVINDNLETACKEVRAIIEPFIKS
jgi:guanylate kinase